MKNRQDVARNISSAAADRARILHAVTEGWDQYIRGIDTIENTGTGRRYEVSNRSAQDVVNALNKTDGDHWQDFQMDQLVPR